MGKQRSGQLTNEHVWLHTPKLRRRSGVSNGFRRREGTKDLQQQARIAASPFIGKLQGAEADMSLIYRFSPRWNLITRMVSDQKGFCVPSQGFCGFQGKMRLRAEVGQRGSLLIAYKREIARFAFDIVIASTAQKALTRKRLS